MSFQFSNKENNECSLGSADCIFHLFWWRGKIILSNNLFNNYLIVERQFLKKMDEFYRIFFEIATVYKKSSFVRENAPVVFVSMTTSVTGYLQLSSWAVVLNRTWVCPHCWYIYPVIEQHLFFKLFWFLWSAMSHSDPSANSTATMDDDPEKRSITAPDVENEEPNGEQVATAQVSQITREKMLTTLIICFCNLINFMDRYSLPGNNTLFTSL